MPDNIETILARLPDAKRSILRGVAALVKSEGEQAFTRPAKRPAPWAPLKRTGKPATLRGNPPVLMRSFRVGEPAGDSIRLEVDRPYAAAHQFGAPSRNLPARPYLPFDSAGNLLPRLEPLIISTVDRILSQLFKN